MSSLVLFATLCIFGWWIRTRSHQNSQEKESHPFGNLNTVQNPVYNNFTAFEETGTNLSHFDLSSMTAFPNDLKASIIKREDILIDKLFSKEVGRGHFSVVFKGKTLN